jgi:hypothetical protein
MAAGNLFGIDLTPITSSNSSDVPVGEPRLERANRVQLRMEARNLEDLVPDDHRVRALWSAVCALDLSEFYDSIRARGDVTRPPCDRSTRADHGVAVRHE